MVKASLNSLALLQAIFPGNESVPGFVDLEDKAELAESLNNIDAISSAYVALRNQNPGSDVNEIIQLMKHDDSIDVTAFLNCALEVYFSSPEVVSKITHTPVPLFPNERVLPDVNHDLLEPVFVRMILE